MPLYNDKKKQKPSKEDTEEYKAAQARKRKLHELKERDLEEEYDSLPSRR